VSRVGRGNVAARGNATRNGGNGPLARQTRPPEKRLQIAIYFRFRGLTQIRQSPKMQRSCYDLRRPAKSADLTVLFFPIQDRFDLSEFSG
jgi:hypothetical protein